MRRININKKGAEMAIGTLVVIVLAILVLVLLAFGFGAGWKTLLERLAIFGGTRVNVDTLKTSCTQACLTSQYFEYCCVQRDIIYKDEAGKTTRVDKSEDRSCMANSLIRPEECTLDCTDVRQTDQCKDLVPG